jgi:hypothetical protein
MPMTLPVARTNREAHLYMDIHPCSCGEVRFDRRSSVVYVDDDLASRYSGTCARCGAGREFTFRMPADITVPAAPDQVRFGGDTPSVLIDPGEWLLVADRHSRAVPADPARLDPPRRRQARLELATAAAAIEEIMKFAEPGADAVPASACWTARGISVYDQEPGRFRLSRLSAVRDTYRRLMVRYR